MTPKKKGSIIPNGVVLETHESATVVFLTELGYDVELIQKGNIKGQHTPDMLINGEKWEMKSPKGEGSSLMKNTIQKALRQSRNVIIDLRRTKRNETKCIHECELHFSKIKRIKRLVIITKSGKMIDLKK